MFKRPCLVLLAVAVCSAVQAQTPKDALEPWIKSLIRQHDVDALSIAIVDGDRVVWSAGFGYADAKSRTPAAADSIYRVGSISKLFTDIALMQLVVEGKIDLDAPLAKALPGFETTEGWEKKVTLRQIAAHRAGIVREPPRGHYFDPDRPTLIETIDSLKGTRLIHPPGEKFKYSNAGIALIGRVIEVARGKSFEESIKETMLGPLGMTEATFDKTPERLPKQVHAKMWAYDGREFPAPTFPMGIGPAGDLRASVLDLSKFAIALMNGGTTQTGAVILPKETIEELWKPRFDKKGARVDVGVGFFLSKLDGKRRVGHGGAVYGCATELMILPDDRLAVAVATSKDCANGLAARVGEAALRAMIAAREGKPQPALPLTTAPGAANALAAAGRFGEKGSLDLIPSGDRIFLLPTAGGSMNRLRLDGRKFVVDDVFSHGNAFTLEGDTLKGNGKEYRRVSSPTPEPLSDEWAGLIGEYGWDHNILNILEKDGKLQVLIEWFFLYPLEKTGKDEYRFPDFGLYSDEPLTFKRDASGRATEVVAAGVRFARRKIDGENGVTFRIKPLRPVAEIRKEFADSKPREEKGTFKPTDLVDLASLDPTIKLDIRYASDNNFLGTPLYTSARAFLQRPAAEALLRAHWTLAREGRGLLIHDGYRPWAVTKIFWEATPPESRMFVADPSKGSKHNRGCAVDLSLYDLKTGKPIEMVSGYDEFSARAYPDYLGGTSRQRAERDRLRRAMEEQGFTVNINEWWHFDYKDWPSYRIGNASFEQLSK